PGACDPEPLHLSAELQRRRADPQRQGVPASGDDDADARTIIATERFITHLWGWDTNVDTSVILVHISNLRKKINALGAPLEIRFVRGAGYLLEVRA
ncbi:helix-turn-helix domain-containing protein, partial [Candidatus Allofournierella excrementavium]|uniref:helix-turn-helix domain-containing protein n=1 Tax=Candidatus Allofournierella excrementavium TaxID=2838591 RepID=UPI003A8C6883